MKLFEIFDSKSIKVPTINNICDKYKIRNYTINDDLSIDVNDNVNLNSKGLTKFPLRFNKVFGDFNCNHNKLKSLEGCPRIVGGYFFCYDNCLVSLIGSPKYVGENFSCFNNKLSSLMGGPKYVGGIYNCSNNLLKSFEGCPTNMGSFYCNNTPLEKLFTIIGTNNISLFSEYDIIQGDSIILEYLKEFLLDIKYDRNIEYVTSILNTWKFI